MNQINYQILCQLTKQLLQWPLLTQPVLLIDVFTGRLGMVTFVKAAQVKESARTENIRGNANLVVVDLHFVHTERKRASANLDAVDLTFARTESKRTTANLDVVGLHTARMRGERAAANLDVVVLPYVFTIG